MLDTRISLFGFSLHLGLPLPWLGPLRGAQEIAQQNQDFGSLDSNLFSKSTSRCGWAWVCSSLSPFGAWSPLGFVIQRPPPCSLPGVRRPLPNPHGVQSSAGSRATRCAPGSQIGGRQRRNEEEVGVSELAGQGRGGLGGLNRIRSV